MRQTEITNNESNQRLDKYLAKYLNTAPKSFIYKMLRTKHIKLNSARAHGDEMLKPGDVVTFYINDDTADSFMKAREIHKAAGVEVIFEDENILVCNKPQGVLSHSGSDEDRDTMVDRLLYYLAKKKEYSPGKTSTFTPGICNRLDRNTSGILLCGKNLASMQALNKMTAERKTEKYYTALVVGRIDKPRVLKGSYEKDCERNYAMIDKDSDAEDVLTELLPIKATEAFSLLELRLVTGKSHQIRAHLSGIGHPIAGDPKYGNSAMNSMLLKKFGIKYQLLNASRLILNEATGHLGYLHGVEFKCELPDNFSKAAEKIFI